jgi:hypothetical protein
MAKSFSGNFRTAGLFSPRISFTPANVITREATNRSAIANEAKNRFPIRRRLRSVYIAIQTRMFPAIDRKIRSPRKDPECEKFSISAQ